MLYAISIETQQKFFTWLDVPFLLNVRTKWKFVSFEAAITTERHIGKADEENRVRREAPAPIIPTSLQFDVDRDNIVQSAINNVDKYWNCEDNSESVCVWLMPLVVNFRRESAIDLGGPSKDFFHHLFSALLDSGMSMFRKIDEQATSTDVWFNQLYSQPFILDDIKPGAIVAGANVLSPLRLSWY
nr:uncharacterized protein LOC129280056 [Lytechinus pictus]